MWPHTFQLLRFVDNLPIIIDVMTRPSLPRAGGNYRKTWPPHCNRSIRIQASEPATEQGGCWPVQVVVRCAGELVLVDGQARSPPVEPISRGPALAGLPQMDGCQRGPMWASNSDGGMSKKGGKGLFWDRPLLETSRIGTRENSRDRDGLPSDLRATMALSLLCCAP